MSEPTETLAPVDAAEASAKKKSKGITGFLVLLLPMVLLPASAGAYLAYGHYPALARTAVALGFTGGLAAEAHAATAAGEAEGGKPQEFGQFKVISDLLVNPAGSNGKRFLMVNIGLESKTEKVFEEIDGKDTVVRDIILQRLGERTVEQLSSVGTREEIKEELRTAINGVLQKGKVDRLYFTQFVLQ